ncbi:MAG TPA: dihydrofolate reductase family protein [Chitinophagaceae bacterium]|nr:dihydrofolate reductase family protein [Chitinophagaceae bacterium]
MRKIISLMHMSLDGFVAGPKGEMNWIKVDEPLFDFIAERISRCDTSMYGRVTYEMMEGYWPTAASKPNASKHDIEHSRWYGQVRKLVLSTTLKEADLKNTLVLNKDLANSVRAIKETPGSEILLFGSPSATHALMQLGLIDGYWIFVNPIILGEGIPLFADVKNQVKLQLQHTHSFASGVTELNYMVAG